MKKMLSLAAMFAVLAYASPASAELKLSGDAGVRLRDVTYFGDTGMEFPQDDVLWQYRVRLNASADLGSGYFFKAMVTNETLGGGWVTSNNGLNEFDLTVSNFYFGRMQENCHWMVGRLPLNSLNNPIFDLTLYPIQPLESPVAFANMDRVLGVNYGVKLGDGMLNTTVVALDNDFRNDTAAEGDGLLNDGYALHLDYKVKVGDVTLEPQFLTVLTNANIYGQNTAGVPVPGATKVTPYTFGALVGVPAGDAKLSFGAFYTHCNDTEPNTTTEVDYDGYLFRIKGEIGNFMAWYDYNHSEVNDTDVKFSNHFVWAQYKIPVYSSAAGSVTIQPTLRYLAAKGEGMGAENYDYSRLRSELWATVTF